MENNDQTIPADLMREILVFLLLFGIGNALKSFFYQGGQFASEDCIGASITISILVYMHWYKDRKTYEAFINQGKRLRTNIFLLLPGTILVASGIYLGNGMEPTTVEMIKETTTFIELFLNLAGLGFAFASYTLFYFLTTMGFYTISLPVLRLLSSNYLDKQT